MTLPLPSAEHAPRADGRGMPGVWEGEHEPVTVAVVETLRRLCEHAGASDAELHVTSAAMRLAAAALDSREMYEQALVSLVELLDVQAAALFVYDEERGDVRLRAQHGLAGEAVRRLEGPDVPVELRLTLTGCMSHGQMSLIMLPERGDGELLVEELALEKPAVLLVKPLYLGQRPVGVVLGIRGSLPADPEGSLLTRLHALGDALGMAVGHEALSARRMESIKAELISLLSHEFRTPLTSILGFAEVLADGDAGELTEEQLAYLKIIEASARRLQQQVEKLLTLSRLQEGRIRTRRRSLALRAPISKVLMRMRERAERRGQQVVASVPDRLPAVNADAAGVEQALTHLLDNALKFSPDGATVRLDVTHTHREVILSVANPGSHIPHENTAAVFSPFSRTKRADDDAIQGAGLGLAVAKGLIERHGGRIWVESDEATGTVFYVSLRVAATLH